MSLQAAKPRAHDLQHFHDFLTRFRPTTIELPKASKLSPRCWLDLLPSAMQPHEGNFAHSVGGSRGTLNTWDPLHRSMACANV